MATVIFYSSCPVCGSLTIRKVLSAKDYMITQQEFEIWECDSCSLRFTQAIPTEEEIGPYYQSENYISHTNTQKGLVNRLYHQVRRITLNNKRKLIESVSHAGKNLLDVGAGTGAFADYMRHKGWQVAGVEADETTRKRAFEWHGLLLHSTSEFFTLQQEYYDIITLWHVLEHVHSLHEYMEQLKKLLTQNGTLLIAVPNYTSHDAALYKEYWAAWDVPRHLYHFSPNAMRTLLKKHELKLRGIRPMWFDSFYVSMMSEKYKTGKQSIAKGFIKGFASNWKAMRNKERCSSLIYIISK
jgi:2-polyprenyl-3-methyl-5-hydroxy-6-metoxy-1,4-benzoquinol methylase